MLYSQEPTGALNTPALSGKEGSVKFSSNDANFNPYLLIWTGKKWIWAYACGTTNIHIIQKLQEGIYIRGNFNTLPSQSISLSICKTPNSLTIQTIKRMTYNSSFVVEQFGNLQGRCRCTFRHDRCVETKLGGKYLGKGWHIRVHFTAIRSVSSCENQ